MSELDQYDYELPPELIAQQPLQRRTDARLLVARRAEGTIEHAHVRDLPEILQPGDCLVFNDTKVVPARLVGYRAGTGGRWQGLFISADAQGLWKIIGQTRGRLQSGESIRLVDAEGREAFDLVLVARLDNGVWAARPQASGSCWELLERAGRVPLPPYIRDGETVPEDRDRYQTVYASKPGAVAAPTAGLHFTEDLLVRLRKAGVRTAHVTLHVGIGTFRPIAVDRIDDHVMHSEQGELTGETVEMLEETRRSGGRILAVGTTSVRTLETASADGTLRPWQGETSLFIRPPYRFRAVDGLLTNFHLPRSTLLILVRTFGGDALMRRAYEEAILEGYRFFSYGDAMFVL